MRILLALAALILLATFAPLALYVAPEQPTHSTLSARPIPLDRNAPGRRRVGGLIYLEGWELTSNDARFGGISALHVEDGQILAVSDRGALIDFAVPAKASIRPVRIAPLPDGPGPPTRKRNRDSEAMAVYGADLWIAFESRNAVWRYARKPLTGRGGARPPAMRKWPGNLGGEAMLRARDGRFLILSEGAQRRDGATAALLFDGDPSRDGTAAFDLGYRPPRGYRVTDAAWLPGGRLLVLSRRFRLSEGWSAKLDLIESSRLRPGAVLDGREIAALEWPINIDNMEALGVTRERGRTIVWIASDDNFNPLQRTLLLKFALATGA